MDEKIRNQEEKITTSSSPTKQHQGEKNLNVLTQKEQQEKLREEEGVEIQREPQSETKKNQRGPYRQYEDINALLEKIRYYRIQRHPDSEIMKLLDNMPRRTYYNYVKKLQEQDKQIMEQWISENVEHFAEELMIYRETLCQKLRELQGIIDNKVTAPKDKMQAIGQHFELSEKLYKFEKSGRTDAMNSVKHSFPSLY